MFWGLLLEPGKRYSTTVEKSFHVSKAALDCSSVKNDNEILSVILETEGSEALLCNLCKQKGILQENLDLNFMTGDRLTFECRGHGRIHLTGYLLPDDDDNMSGMFGDEESEEEEEESGWSSPEKAGGSPKKSKKEKRKLDAPPENPAKKKKPVENNVEEDEDDSESMDSESDDELLEDEEGDDEEGEEDESDQDDLEGSEDEEDEELVVNTSQKNKQKQFQKDKSKTPTKQNLNASVSKKTPVTNGISPKEQKSNKKTPVGSKTPNAANTPNTPKHKQVLDQGVIVKDVKVGTGAPAKPGRMVEVHYIGKLKDGNKVFDKKMKGDGFSFKLGKGEVIKAWDIGLQGMKVGGKRVVICPPESAYGAKGAPPKIPPNSTLIFDVELKSVQ